VPETPATHLSKQRLVTQPERAQFATPAQRLGVAGVAGLAGRQDCPYGMQFTVFAQQVLAAEPVHRYIPDSHCPITDRVPRIVRR
jgi:hypothetical protein